MFPCERCGACCKSIKNAFWAKDLINKNGVCKYYNEAKSLCDIYDRRPIYCNIDAYYKEYCSNTVTKEEFYEENLKQCINLRKIFCNS